MTAYDYQELRSKALSSRSKDAVNALGEWMAAYGQDYWNGEEYDIDDGLCLRPVYDWDNFNENDPNSPDLIGYEIF